MTDPRRRDQDEWAYDPWTTKSASFTAPEPAHPRDEPSAFYPWPNPSADDVPGEGA